VTMSSLSRSLAGTSRWIRPRWRESGESYARQRAGYGRAEIQVLDESWNVVETITNEDLKPVV